MNGVGAYWSTDHMFGVPSRIVSKYVLREPKLEMRYSIAQSLYRSKKVRNNEIQYVGVVNWERFYQFDFALFRQFNCL